MGNLFFSFFLWGHVNIFASPVAAAGSTCLTVDFTGFLHISLWNVDTQSEALCQRESTQRRVVIMEWTKLEKAIIPLTRYMWSFSRMYPSLLTSLLCIFVENKTRLVLFFFTVHKYILLWFIDCCKNTVLTACDQSVKYILLSQSSLEHSRGSLIHEDFWSVLDTGNQIVSHHSSRQVWRPVNESALKVLLIFENPKASNWFLYLYVC